MKKNARELSKEEIIEKMKQLSGNYKAPINENVSKHKKLLYYKGAPDGRIYGIIQESSKYYIKVASGSKSEPNVTDFAYIGNTINKSDEQYNGYPDALSRLNLKMKSLNESFGYNKKTVEEEEIPLNAEIDTKVEDKPKADNAEPKTVEPTSTQVPAETPTSTDGGAEDQIVSAEPAPETTAPTTDAPTEETATDSETTNTSGSEGSEESGDSLTDEIQSLLGKLNQSYQERGDNITPQESKAAINSMISSTKSGLEKMNDDEKDSLIKRIENNGKKLDETEDSDSASFIIMGKYKNNKPEKLDTASSKEEADFLTKEYKMSHKKDYEIWSTPSKNEPIVSETEDVLNEDKEKTAPKNKKFNISFTGMKKGSDKEQPFKVSMEGKDEDDAVEKLYNKYQKISKLAINELFTKNDKIKIIQENIKKLINESIGEYEEKSVEEAFNSLSENELQGMVDELKEDGSSDLIDDNWVNEITSKLESIQEESEKMAGEYCNKKYNGSLNEIDLKSILGKATSIFNKKSAEKVINSDPRLKTNFEDGVKAVEAADNGDDQPYKSWKQKVGKSLAMMMLLMKLMSISSAAMASDEKSITSQDVNNVKDKIEQVNQTEPDNGGNTDDGQDSSDTTHTAEPLKATINNGELTVDVDSKFESGQTDLPSDQEAEIEKYLTQTLIKYIQDEVKKSPTKQVKVTVEGSASKVTPPAGKTNQQLADERTAELDKIVTKVLSDALKRGDIKTGDFELIKGTAKVGGPDYEKGVSDPKDPAYKAAQYSKVKATSAGADYKPVKLSVNINVSNADAEWGADRVGKLFNGLKAQNQLPKDVTFDDFVKNIKAGNISIKNQSSGQILNNSIVKNIQ